jgi:hopene-associated glycosyltransferase HpnB
MVRLQCRSATEKLMIPAFVFFFKMLYPFRRINNASDALAGAAGGTMLVRRAALDRIGGMASIRGELIDDCALAREIKRGGRRIWVGLSDVSFSTREYGRLAEIVHMVARTAYTQLGYSPIRLVGCIIGLSLVYLAPVATLFFEGWTSVCAAVTLMLMACLYLPMVRFYRQSPLWALLLPVTASVYLYATVLSAVRMHLGKGGQWKGRSRVQNK